MEHSQIEYAGFWKRFAAITIDGVLIVYFSSSLKWLIAEILNAQAGFSLDFQESQTMEYFVWNFYLLFVRWSYFAGMESSKLQATLGKLAVGLYVVDLNGARISFGQASARFFGKILSGLLLGIGYIMAGVTEKKQALHDQMSNCLVMSK